MRQVIFSLLLAFAATGLPAQSILPLISGGHAQIAVATQAGYQKSDIPEDIVRRRMLSVKVTVGYWQRLDLFGIAGFARDRVQYQRSQLTGLKNNRTGVLGAGAAFKLPQQRVLKLQPYVQILFMRSKPSGDVFEAESQQAAEFRKRFAMNYLWRSWHLDFVAARKIRRYEGFLGFTYLIESATQQTETYLSSSDSEIYVSENSRQWFRSRRLLATAGTIIHLPGSHQAGISVQMGGRSDFRFSISLSQTGSP